MAKGLSKKDLRPGVSKRICNSELGQTKGSPTRESSQEWRWISVPQQTFLPAQKKALNAAAESLSHEGQ